jgi:Polyketide cyclase / dehydrase and lipid transport
MTKLYVKSERLVNHPTDFVHNLFADFVNHHPKFLPPQFTELQLEAGGYGAGTVYNFTSLFGGQVRAFKMLVSEPQPGKVMIEHDQLSTLETTFTFTPEGTRTRITFETVWESAGGLMGALEAWFAPAMMRRLYQDELNRFERYALEVQQASAGKLVHPTS